MVVDLAVATKEGVVQSAMEKFIKAVPMASAIAEVQGLLAKEE